MPDLDLLKSLLEKNRLRKQANKFPEHPTEKQYEKDYTVENSEGKPSFPIRTEGPSEVAVKDAQDALRLLHHEKDPKKKEEVKNRACNVLKKHDPESYEKNCG